MTNPTTAQGWAAIGLPASHGPGRDSGSEREADEDSASSRSTYQALVLAFLKAHPEGVTMKQVHHSSGAGPTADRRLHELRRMGHPISKAKKIPDRGWVYFYEG